VGSGFENRLHFTDWSLFRTPVPLPPFGASHADAPACRPDGHGQRDDDILGDPRRLLIPAQDLVAGEAKPAAEGPAIQVPGGWMVAYDEVIPGTNVSFRMIPVPGGTFPMGSAASEADRNADEGPQFEVTIAPFWMGKCEVTWQEYKSYMAACDLFKHCRRRAPEWSPTTPSPTTRCPLRSTIRR
jgi:hypothetical protein